MSDLSKLKKPTMMASREFTSAFDRFSKAAILDALWCACQLGTDESNEQIVSKAAREVLIALERRDDYVPKFLRELAARPIDSD